MGYTTGSRLPNLLGKRFDRWLVLRPYRQTKDKKGRMLPYYVCCCDCGTERRVHGVTLVKGKSRSCGCMRGALITQNKTRHGGRKSHPKEYRAWRGMKGRCKNTNHRHYASYGGRGITVCAAWENDFPGFLKDVGSAPSPKHSLDRINNDGNYEPSNCRWATATQQAQNTRASIVCFDWNEVKTCVNQHLALVAARQANG